MEHNVRLQVNLSTQRDFPRIVGHNSLMQCDQVVVVIYQFTLKNDDITTQVLFEMLRM